MTGSLYIMRDLKLFGSGWNGWLSLHMIVRWAIPLSNPVEQCYWVIYWPIKARVRRHLHMPMLRLGTIPCCVRIRISHSANLPTVNRVLTSSSLFQRLRYSTTTKTSLGEIMGGSATQKVDTSSRLARLRELMKATQPSPVDVFVIPSEDARQSCR